MYLSWPWMDFPGGQGTTGCSKTVRINIGVRLSLVNVLLREGNNLTAVIEKIHYLRKKCAVGCNSHHMALASSI